MAGEKDKHVELFRIEMQLSIADRHLARTELDSEITGLDDIVIFLASVPGCALKEISQPYRNLFQTQHARHTESPRQRSQACSPPGGSCRPKTTIRSRLF